MSPYVITLTAGAALLFFNYGAYWSATWYSKWAILMGILTVGAAWKLTTKVRWALPLVLTALLSGVWVFGWNFSPYRELPRDMFLALGKYGATSFATFLLGVFGIKVLPESYKPPVQVLLGAICYVGLIQTFLSIGNPDKGGFSGNFSMQGCIIAALVPFLVFWDGLVILTATLVALALLHASNPFGVLLITMASYWWADKKMTADQKGERCAALFLTVFILAVMSTGHPLFDNDGRWDIWKDAMSWWWAHANHWFGTGLGTTPILMPYIQQQGAYAPKQYVLWLHSDWLQILFELGYVGLASALLAWAVIAKRAWKSPRVFGAFMGFSAMGLFNYPLHLPVHAAVLTLLVWLALRRDEARPPGVNDAKSRCPSRNALRSIGQAFGFRISGEPRVELP